MNIYKNKLTGQTRNVVTGFSVTTLFFGQFPALFRGDYKYAIIMTLAAFISFGISWLIFPFIYNDLYKKDLINNGFIKIEDNKN